MSQTDTKPDASQPWGPPSMTAIVIAMIVFAAVVFGVQALLTPVVIDLLPQP